MRRVIRRLAAAAALGVACLPASAVSHVFLVQNSGWMEPFYADPASQFKPLVVEIAAAATDAKNAGKPGQYLLALQNRVPPWQQKLLKHS